MFCHHTDIMGLRWGQHMNPLPSFLLFKSTWNILGQNEVSLCQLLFSCVLLSTHCLVSCQDITFYLLLSLELLGSICVFFSLHPLGALYNLCGSPCLFRYIFKEICWGSRHFLQCSSVYGYRDFIICKILVLILNYCCFLNVFNIVHTDLWWLLY